VRITDVMGLAVGSVTEIVEFSERPGWKPALIELRCDEVDDEV
jgi:hypothetical protein